MSLNVRELAPPLADAIVALGRSPVFQYVNETSWISAVVLTAHLLFLSILGGSVLILNLRLLHATLAAVPVAELERTTRPWRIAGIAGTIVTGALLGLTTANTLMSNGAFLAKMAALAAAILFSTAVAREARRQGSASSDEDVRPGRAAGILAVAGLIWWLASVFLLVRVPGLDTAAFLVAIAGFSVFATFVRRLRRLYALGLIVTLGGGLVLVEGIAHSGGDAPLSLIWLPLVAALALAVGVTTLDRRGGDGSGLDPLRLVAFVSTLAWITVAAAGRWIAFI